MTTHNHPSIPTYYDIILPTTINLHYNWISRMYLRCFVANMNIEYRDAS